MKTIEQTKNYISSCLFDDNDWEKVLNFCRSRFGGGKIHRPKRGIYHTCFEKFLFWFDYMPGQGDVVHYNNLIGMVGRCSPSDYILIAYIDQRDRLILKDMTVFPHKLKIATVEQSAQFRDMLFQSHHCFSPKLNMLTEFLEPQRGEFILVKYNQHFKYAIFDRIEQNNCHLFYLENPNCSTESVTIPVSECEISTISRKEGLDMLSHFAKAGIAWNPQKMEFTPVPLRADFEGKYWYVDDKFHVCQSKDLQTPVHKERYDNGNYFTSYAEALLFLQRIKEIRMELSSRRERPL